MDNMMFYLAHIALVIMIFLLVSTIRMKTNNRMKWYFIQYLIYLFIWTLTVIIQRYCVQLNAVDLVDTLENVVYFAVSFISVVVLLIGINIYLPNNRMNKWLRFLYIVPIVTQIILWTNPLHHLFYVYYDYFDVSRTVVGAYFYVHTIYSYTCLLFGTIYTIYFATRNKGRMDSTLKALLICIGTSVPLVVNICFTLALPGFNNMSTPVAFVVTCITYFLLLFKYNILQISPAVMKQVIDMTSDLYVVVDENMMIIDYNEPFETLFSKLINLRRQVLIVDVLEEENDLNLSMIDIGAIIEECRTKQETLFRDLGLVIDGKNMYYSVEFNPLLIEGGYYGCIILFRDITRAVNDMQQIQANQDQLIKQERLASLGQLISGIAHNLNTPIMAISGRAESLDVLIDEYINSIPDPKVTIEDHHEIAEDMKKEIENIRNHTSYISEIISAVKGQTVRLSGDTYENFTIRDLVKRIDLLLRHEVIRNKCNLIYEIQTNESLEITGGDMNSLIQVIDNAVMNAMQAYKGVPGDITIKISRSEGEVVFTISDTAGGIPLNVQDKIFQEMITSKGKDGTGLGLYISYSTILGIFGGKMWYNSVDGVGTDIYFTVPLVA
ncbi:MAG: ATP-binding protein [Oscillospiraceae bacterium]|nr:ATP-binding protein [Oscillospiraceae bacterium]